MVTEAAVWDALAEIPDPEIPVISLVDLGVVREVEVEDGRVRVAFTPTVLGCPATFSVPRSSTAGRPSTSRRRRLTSSKLVSRCLAARPSASSASSSSRRVRGSGSVRG